LPDATPLLLPYRSPVLDIPVVVVAGWREGLAIIQADTVLRWRRYGITVIWKYRSRGRWQGGRPRILAEIRQLSERWPARIFFGVHPAFMASY